MKEMAVALPEIGTYAVVGALTLYLDFITIFFILRLLAAPRLALTVRRKMPQNKQTIERKKAFGRILRLSCARSGRRVVEAENFIYAIRTWTGRA